MILAPSSTFSVAARLTTVSSIVSVTPVFTGVLSSTKFSKFPPSAPLIAVEIIVASSLR